MDGFVSLASEISQYAATLGIHMADQDGHRVMGYFDGNDLNSGGLTAKTIWQELDAAGVSWKIYSEETNLFTYLQDFAYFNQPGVSAKVVSINQFSTDAAAGDARHDRVLRFRQQVLAHAAFATGAEHKWSVRLQQTIGI
jgi:phospholipase C